MTNTAPHTRFNFFWGEKIRDLILFIRKKKYSNYGTNRPEFVHNKINNMLARIIFKSMILKKFNHSREYVQPSYGQSRFRNDVTSRISNYIILIFLILYYNIVMFTLHYCSYQFYISLSTRKNHIQQ